MHGRTIAMNGKIIDLSQFTRPVAVLVSRRGENWATQNDRFQYKTTQSGHSIGLEDQISLAEREAQDWHNAQPTAQFKVMIVDASEIPGQKYLDRVK